jgi:LmbE family N-acetylglucosaminyl deacetylase
VQIAAVSAHLDDAALSASASLAGRGATVLTVFDGLPAADMPASSWDRMTGAENSLDRQRERLAEDARAMTLLGASGRHLGELEAAYRTGPPDLTRAVEQLTGAFGQAGQVWLPAAIGGHRDHLLARDAGLLAAVAAGHAEVVLYADFPYVIAYGWPSWVSGKPASPYLDAGSWLAGQLESAGLNPQLLTPSVIRLSGAQRALKAAVIAAYRTQAPALGLTRQDLAGHPAKLDFELYWRMPAAPRRRSSSR